MADPTTPDPRAAAEAWYLGFRERELAAVGKTAPAALLGEKLRLELAPGAAAVPPGAPMTLGLVSRLSDCNVRLNATDGRLISWYVDALAAGGTEALPPAEALAVAQAATDIPADAVLSEHGYETMAGRTFFRARWHHVVDGLPVEDDYLEVLVNGHFGKAFALSRVWHEPRVGLGPAER